MASIRDVVQELGQREGVETAVVLGRDGLPIDSFSQNGLDADGIAALVPSLVGACDRLGQAGTRGDFTATVIEYGNGFAIVSIINAETLFAVFVRPDTNVGSILHELNKYRTAIAGLL
ncbi:MAG: roadblock/LC7 domain-containing protein [Gemmatimonadetes bacterium]|nr:roadblock/LC7 domain-containing protein [Gemmatimonadota bacterium]